MATLEANIKEINRVGQATATRLKRLGVTTVQDLLYYFPFRYDDFTEITPIDKLTDGQKANIVGEVDLIQNKRSLRKRMNITEAIITDGSESIKVVWFNQPYISKTLKTGDKISLAGKIKYDIGGLSMISPHYEKLKANESIHTQGLVPQYHLTANLTQKQVRFLVSQVVGEAKHVEDWLPHEVKNRKKLIDLPDAIRDAHFPPGQERLDKAKRRLAFDELFLIQLKNQLAKQEFNKIIAPKIEFREKTVQKFVSSLPFTLTSAQKKSAWKIIQDMDSEKPMTRLLEGDVGSGKTVVAAIAMMNTAKNGYQAALMVPTEILALQHYQSLGKMLEPLDMKIGLFTRVNCDLDGKKIAKKEFIDRLKQGQIQMVIGTHALIQEKIGYKNLALAVIDEQHRFGVKQRKRLITMSGGKDSSPHLLSMTATPIPRSLAMALYGDLDISIIDELPKGRKSILTKIIPEHNRQKAYTFINQEIRKGRQAYVICPLIDYSDKLGVKSVKEEYNRLNDEIFPDLEIEMLHGKMKSDEKDRIMRDFMANKAKVLVSTSVIEVGVDVPNATIMMIEDADRFGLAQLHQFRGRVGRAQHQSYCLLFTESNADRTMERLNALSEHNNGFELAKIDLEFRGPGEVYGSMQKGFPELKQASLYDFELMNEAKEEAAAIYSQDSELSTWPGIQKKIARDELSTYLAA